jgi:hypothetical protein
MELRAYSRLLAYLLVLVAVAGLLGLLLWTYVAV